MKTLVMFLASAAFVFGSCDNTTYNQDGNSDVAAVSEVLDLQKGGYELLKSTCYACHNPTVESHDNIIAPPLAGIKMRYQQEFGDRDNFIKGMSGFISNPNQESALMKGPVRRFGLMPNPNLEEKDIKMIVEYIYDNKLEEPKWFSGHYKEMHGN